MFPCLGGRRSVSEFRCTWRAAPSRRSRPRSSMRTARPSRRLTTPGPRNRGHPPPPDLQGITTTTTVILTTMRPEVCRLHHHHLTAADTQDETRPARAAPTPWLCRQTAAFTTTAASVILIITICSTDLVPLPTAVVAAVAPAVAMTGIFWAGPIVPAAGEWAEVVPAAEASPRRLRAAPAALFVVPQHHRLMVAAA